MLHHRIPRLLALALALAPLLAATALDPAPEGSFSIVVLPDTQGYRGANTKATPDSADPVTNPVFEAHTRWIADNIDTQRIAFVTHVGDIVDKTSKPSGKSRASTWTASTTASPTASSSATTI